MPRILIADSDPDVPGFLARSLSTRRIKVETVPAGRDVLRHIVAGDIDVLITEVHLPDLPAWRLIPHVRALDPGLPVIALTYDDSWETSRRVRITAGPVFFYALKPPLPEQIRQVVQCALKWRRKYAGKPRLTLL